MNSVIFFNSIHVLFVAPAGFSSPRAFQNRSRRRRAGRGTRDMAQHLEGHQCPVQPTQVPQGTYLEVQSSRPHACLPFRLPFHFFPPTLTTIFIATPFPRSTPWSCLLSAHTLVFWPMDLLACSAAVVNGLAPTALPQWSIFSAFLAAPSANVPLDVSFEALHGPANTHHLVVTDSKPFHTAQNLPRL